MLLRDLQIQNIKRKEEVAYNIIYHPLTMQYRVPSPHSLTAIHTWDHLAITTHMKASWVNNPQVAQMTLTLRAHKYS